ncbi:Dockerin type I repeat protein [Novipirellula galeiformis]|uniref:Dockerin type I repeat protein n=2 Tax=Novipirellula galeiformis TaxID=2528004 RepID=A0A5C6CP80_9BACT|nr:Dockerin type I repeat protein [Novipirellula galeiformis]
MEMLEKRNLLAAAPLGATEMDTAEFMLGRVAITPVFFESNGSIDPESQNWTADEIDEVLAKIREGVNWWSETLDTLDTVHSLEFVINDEYAKTPVQTPYELIDRNSEGYQLAAGAFMDSLGYPGSSALQNAVMSFNHDQRIALGTDWAFTLFVVDSSDDVNPTTGEHDGLFAKGGLFQGAFAFSGGLFMVTPSTRPASTITHEMGHIFWARDEYDGKGASSWTDRRGYYNAQNLNAADNPTPGFVHENSIMRSGFPLTEAYNQHVSPTATLAMIGWQDSDDNGIFDVLDVPLDLQGIGHFDLATTTYHFDGHATAVALPNKNSQGPQSDITLNRVSEIQYRLDDGPWIVASQPDQQVVDFELEVVIDQGFSRIDWRAVDGSTGITSNVVHGTIGAPAISANNITGFAFLDQDNNSVRAGSEPFLTNASATIRHADGSPLFSGRVEANELPNGTIASDSLSGVSLTNQGYSLNRQLEVASSPIASNQKFFQSFNSQLIVLSERWNKRQGFVAEFDENVGEVRLQIWGADHQALSYGRIEAYDSAGQLIKRVTSEGIAYGMSTQLTIQDDRGRIAEIRAFGHAETSIAISAVEFGIEDQYTIDESGALKFNHLADGQYMIELSPENLIHAFEQPNPIVNIVDGTSEGLVAIAHRVTSPRHNPLIAGDVNQDQIVTANDALIIINDLNVNQPRLLTANEIHGEFIDVNNDGTVTALDALLVINTLMKQTSGGEGESPQNDPVLGEAPVAQSSPPDESDLGIGGETLASRGLALRNDASGNDASSHDAVLTQWPRAVLGDFAPQHASTDYIEPIVDAKLKTPTLTTIGTLLPEKLPLSEQISEKFPENLVVNELLLSTMESESIATAGLAESNQPLSNAAN